MDNNRLNFIHLEITDGLMFEHDDGHYITHIYGFTPGSQISLPAGFTHIGIVTEGQILIKYGNKTRSRELFEGDYFSVIGPSIIISDGIGMVNSAKNYLGLNTFGGPIEETGRLLYIDGCTDTLLIPPLRKGDPCYNHLHFPKNIVQTQHTHPSVRTGLVYKGEGVAILPNEVIKEVPLKKNNVFILRPETIHSFNTKDQTMDVIAFHPDSDVGVTDDDHPMVNRTIVNGTSSSEIKEIRTK